MKDCSPLPLFTYGSLMENLFNYQKYLKGKTLTKPRRARVKGQLFHLDNKGYPALIPGDDWVYGEIFELQHFADTILAVDTMENYFGADSPYNEYERQTIEVAVFNETTQAYDEWIEVYCYFYNLTTDPNFNNHSLYLSSGNWRNYHEQLIS